jgi:hypothetical protein
VDLNRAPIFMRPVVRVGLPWRFTEGLRPGRVVEGTVHVSTQSAGVPRWIASEPLRVHSRGLGCSFLEVRGMTFSGTAGVSYLPAKQFALTVDAFYTPRGVARDSGPTDE